MKKCANIVCIIWHTWMCTCSWRNFGFNLKFNAQFICMIVGVNGVYWGIKLTFYDLWSWNNTVKQTKPRRCDVDRNFGTNIAGIYSVFQCSVCHKSRWYHICIHGTTVYRLVHTLYKSFSYYSAAGQITKLCKNLLWVCSQICE